MLQAAGCGAAEHEQCRSQHAGWHRPSRAPAHDGDGDASREQMGKNNQIECPHRRGRIEHPPGHEHRREHQRLRVCDTRMPAIMIGIPERPLAGAERRGQEAEEGIELVLGIPGHDGVADDPAADGGKPDGRDQADRNGQSAGPFSASHDEIDSSIRSAPRDVAPRAVATHPGLATTVGSASPSEKLSAAKSEPRGCES